jgi:SAM-dependent methyltransferase
MYKIIIKLLMMFCLTLPQVFAAATFTFHQALESFYKSKPNIPAPENDGRMPTLNKKGATSPNFDYVTLEFLKFAENKRVLEIGGAYGNVMLEALHRNSSTIYHLNDLEERHLTIAAFRLQEKIDRREICMNGLENVQFIYGDITQPSWKVKEPYDAILMARVIHFLNPKQIQQALSNLYTSLKPGGRVFIIALTPYVNRYQSFIPKYEKRLKSGEPYPGYVTDLRKYVNKDVTTQNQINSISDGSFMFLDDIVLLRLFTNAGFKVLECALKPLSYYSPSWALDGRENVILIAEKP